MPTALLESETTKSIIGAFYEVYNALGFGFLERTYSLALEMELKARGHKVNREYAFTVYSKGRPVNKHRLDMVVDDKVVVECKSTARLPHRVKRQTRDHLRASDLEVGMVLHFGPTPYFKRIVCTRKPRRD